MYLFYQRVIFEVSMFNWEVFQEDLGQKGKISSSKISCFGFFVFIDFVNFIVNIYKFNRFNENCINIGFYKDMFFRVNFIKLI